MCKKTSDLVEDGFPYELLCQMTLFHMNQCKLKNIKTRGAYLWNLFKVFSKTTPVAPQSQLPSQLCQVSSCGLILFFISFLSHSNPHLISLILRKLLEDNEDLRVIFLIRYSDIVAEHGQFCMKSGNDNDELSNIKLMPKQWSKEDEWKWCQGPSRDYDPWRAASWQAPAADWLFLLKSAWWSPQGGCIH